MNSLPLSPVVLLNSVSLNSYLGLFALYNILQWFTYNTVEPLSSAILGEMGGGHLIEVGVPWIFFTIGLIS